MRARTLTRSLAVSTSISGRIESRTGLCAASTTTRRRRSRSSGSASGPRNAVLGGGRYDNLVRQIDRDRSLARVDQIEERRRATPCSVRSVQALDLDHLGAPRARAARCTVDPPRGRRDRAPAADPVPCRIGALRSHRTDARRPTHSAARLRRHGSPSADRDRRAHRVRAPRLRDTRSPRSPRLPRRGRTRARRSASPRHPRAPDSGRASRRAPRAGGSDGRAPCGRRAQGLRWRLARRAARRRRARAHSDPARASRAPRARRAHTGREGPGRESRRAVRAPRQRHCTRACPLRVGIEGTGQCRPHARVAARLEQRARIGTGGSIFASLGGLCRGRGHWPLPAFSQSMIDPGARRAVPNAAGSSRVMRGWVVQRGRQRLTSDRISSYFPPPAPPGTRRAVAWRRRDPDSVRT